MNPSLILVQFVRWPEFGISYRVGTSRCQVLGLLFGLQVEALMDWNG